MEVCADAHMACGCLVPLLADGIRRRKDAVVYRSSFSNKASSLPLGLWDKLNNLTHVFTPIISISSCRSVDAASKPRAGSKTHDGIGCCEAAFSLIESVSHGTTLDDAI